MCDNKTPVFFDIILNQPEATIKIRNKRKKKCHKQLNKSKINFN